MIKISIYSLIFATLSFSLLAMEQMPEINFSHVTEQGLEAFCLAYKMRCYHQLNLTTITSLEKRMSELGITPDDDRFISLINKLYTNKAITPLQENTLKRFQRARLMRGYEEVHMPSLFPNKGHMVITIRANK